VTHSIRTVLWFNGRGREAARFYCSLIPNSRVLTEFAGDGGPTPFEVIDFSLNGVPYQILDAGPHFPLSECVSIMVNTPDQAETDRLWAALTADGGVESQCGWLTDRFGLSWQITPEAALRLLSDPESSSKVMPALMKMKRIDISALETAARAGA
jgi:predicted 3-demethylubiquinone-9 3-methyltransferase (glyoxalase superfamily)